MKKKHIENASGKKARRHFRNATAKFVSFIVGLILVVLLLQSVNLKNTIAENEHKKQELIAQIQKAQEELEDIKKLGLEVQTDEYKEDYARRNMGLYNDDEVSINVEE